MLNVGNPENAFLLGQLPSAGVGLLRIEFVVSSAIGIHPMALVHPERVTSSEALAQIRKRAAGFSAPVGAVSAVRGSGVALNERCIVRAFSNSSSFD